MPVFVFLNREIQIQAWAGYIGTEADSFSVKHILSNVSTRNHWKCCNIYIYICQACMCRCSSTTEIHLRQRRHWSLSIKRYVRVVGRIVRERWGYGDIISEKMHQGPDGDGHFICTIFISSVILHGGRQPWWQMKWTNRNSTTENHRGNSGCFKERFCEMVQNADGLYAVSYKGHCDK